MKPIKKLGVRKETIRQLVGQPLGLRELADVAGGVTRILGGCSAASVANCLPTQDNSCNCQTI
jgi:hypothetical protein